MLIKDMKPGQTFWDEENSNFSIFYFYDPEIKRSTGWYYDIYKGGWHGPHEYWRFSEKSTKRPPIEQVRLDKLPEIAAAVVRIRGDHA